MRTEELLEGRTSEAVPRQRAVVLLELGRHAEAVQAAARAVQIAPDSADARTVLAWSHFKNGALDHAAESIRLAVDLDPMHHDASWVDLAVSISVEDRERARAALARASEIVRETGVVSEPAGAASYAEELALLRPNAADLQQLIAEAVEFLSTPKP